jgi:pheromone shutdown protein TraB
VPKEEPKEDPQTIPVVKVDRDEFLMTKVMREAINKKYKILQVIGKGSYGCVSKAQCLETG